ncbi:hypothetical protein B0H14DRAFT_3891119 [Mycena olivaceomarginata]|nr:hypothetical protein B0H14DRAFT_3891119 [Mycena olivaceomarginata]
MTPRDMCGIYFCLRHRYLWPLLRARFIPCLILSIIVLPTLFIFAYLPQVAFLAIFQGNLAWFNAVFLVLGEGAAIIALLFEAFFVDETLVKIFDAASRSSSESPTKSAIYSPFSFRLTLEFILLLPLTFIPLFGGPLYCLVLGRRAGPFQHYRYFKLLGLTRTQQQAFVRKRQWKYTWFGMVALLLQLVPVFSMLFLLTTRRGGGVVGGGFE